MTDNSQPSIEDMKAERKRLATARGLLTRERNKLARERDQVAALTAELEERKSELADERQQVEELRLALKARETEYGALEGQLVGAREDVARSQEQLALKEAERAEAVARADKLRAQLAALMVKQMKPMSKKKLLKKAAKAGVATAAKVSKKALRKKLAEAAAKS